MLGTIGLEGLRLDCVIGTEAAERSRTQPLDVDVEADLDLEAAAAADDLEQTVDYRAIAEQLQALADRRRFRLIEAFAEEATALLLERWPSLIGVRLEVRKPGALERASHSFCRVERRRGP